jgi:hypothetical protein
MIHWNTNNKVLTIRSSGSQRVPIFMHLALIAALFLRLTDCKD